MTSNGPKALHQVVPREQVGAQTGALYDYQYHQAAAEALSLLDDTQISCLYCEWHDDYVTETTANSAYCFHQVKTRQKSKGPWGVGEFFGLARKQGEPAKSDSIFGRLWDHVLKFGDRCEMFVFVTDAGIDTKFQDLLTESAAGRQPDDLSQKPRKTFDRILAGLKPTFDISAEKLLGFLCTLRIQDGVGAVHDGKSARVLIAVRILEASEVDLKISEAEKIGADLVATVRDRSHRILKELPSTRDELRASKGIGIDNLLPLLSLSTEGYRELKAGGRDSVRALSRLHRLCRRSNVPDSLIPDFCRFKAAWEAWWIDQRHRIEQADYLALKGQCATLLRAHSEGNLPLDQLVAQAKALASTYATQLAASQPLTGELILGFIFSLAAEAEV